MADRDEQWGRFKSFFDEPSSWRYSRASWLVRPRPALIETARTLPAEDAELISLPLAFGGVSEAMLRILFPAWFYDAIVTRAASSEHARQVWGRSTFGDPPFGLETFERWWTLETFGKCDYCRAMEADLSSSELEMLEIPASVPSLRNARELRASEGRFVDAALRYTIDAFGQSGIDAPLHLYLRGGRPVDREFAAPFRARADVRTGEMPQSGDCLVRISDVRPSGDVTEVELVLERFNVDRRARQLAHCALFFVETADGLAARSRDLNPVRTHAHPRPRHRLDPDSPLNRIAWARRQRSIGTMGDNAGADAVVYRITGRPEFFNASIASPAMQSYAAPQVFVRPEPVEKGEDDVARMKLAFLASVLSHDTPLRSVLGPPPVLVGAFDHCWTLERFVVVSEEEQFSFRLDAAAFDTVEIPPGVLDQPGAVLSRARELRRIEEPLVEAALLEVVQGCRAEGDVGPFYVFLREGRPAGYGLLIRLGEHADVRSVTTYDSNSAATVLSVESVTLASGITTVSIGVLRRTAGGDEVFSERRSVAFKEPLPLVRR